MYGQRVITTELLAQVYETDTNNITQNFKRNKSNFREGVHYFLLQGKDLDSFRLQVTDSHLQISPMTRSLYLWTERGANRHCKILDTPKAWEQFDNLEETYFMVKEQRREAVQGKRASSAEELAAEKRATTMLLNAKNRAAAFLQKLYDRAGVKPEYQALAVSDFYQTDGVHLPRIALQGTKVTYDKRTIAEKLGVYSKASGGKAPHTQAMGAIISELTLSPEEREAVPYIRNGHDGTDFQYTQSVIDKVHSWLEERAWPDTISAGGKNYPIVYRKAKG